MALFGPEGAYVEAFKKQKNAQISFYYLDLRLELSIFVFFSSCPINFEHRQLRGGGGFDGPVVGEHGKQFQYDSLSRGEFWCWGQ